MKPTPFCSFIPGPSTHPVDLDPPALHAPYPCKHAYHLIPPCPNSRRRRQQASPTRKASSITSSPSAIRTRPKFNIRSRGYRFRINSPGVLALREVLTPSMYAAREQTCADLAAGSIVRLVALTGRGWRGRKARRSWRESCRR